MSKLKIEKKLKYFENNNENARKIPKYSDKVVLPESILEDLINQQRTLGLSKLPHPLIFKISSPSNNCFVGVREFVSNHGEIELPELIKDRLGISSKQEETPIYIEFSNTFQEREKENQMEEGEVKKNWMITIRPKQIYDVKNWKSFLEAKLPGMFTTLSTGDTIFIENNNAVYELDVVHVEPQRTVCVVDRDIELIVEPGNDEIAKKMLEQRDNDRDNNIVDLEKSGKLVNLGVGQIKVNKNDIIRCSSDFAISYNKYIDTNNFLKCTLDSGIKELTVEEDVDIAYFIGIGEENEFEFELVTDKVKDIGMDVDTELDDDSIVCQYCRSIISKNAQILHENFCKRNNIICDKGCGQTFFKEIPKTHWHCCNSFGDTIEKLSKHREYVHTREIPLQCSDCLFKCSTLIDLAKHKSIYCPGGLHECRFCFLELPRGESSIESRFSNLTQHEYECGNKTTECFKCGKIIRQRDMESHFHLHDLDRKQKPAPKVCSNANCVHIIEDTNCNNLLGLCNTCFGPLFSTIFDPDGKKLRNRIERKYVLQLKNGCDNKECDNDLCGNSPNCKINTGNMSDIIKFVKNELLINSTKFWFCVGQSMRIKKNFIGMVLDDNELKYGYEWICKAVETTGSCDLNKVIDWLRENGVRKDEMY